MLAPERHAQHAPEYHYERHRPEASVLYKVVSTYWSEFRERLEGVGILPKFVVRDVDEYLRCGLREYGFIRVQCTDCGFERLVALSCKRGLTWAVGVLSTQGVYPLSVKLELPAKSKRGGRPFKHPKPDQPSITAKDAIAALGCTVSRSRITRGPLDLVHA